MNLRVWPEVLVKMIRNVTHMKNLARIVSFAALTIFAVGCTKTLNKESLETNIKATYEKKGIKMKSLDCPAGKPFKAGDSFECNGELDEGGKISIVVKQKDDKGNLDLDVTGLVIKEDEVSEVLTKEGGGAKIEAKCPKKVSILRKGETVSCQFSGAATGKVDYTTADDKTVEQKLAIAGQEPKTETVKPASADLPNENAAAGE